MSRPAPAVHPLGRGFDRAESVHWLANGDIAASHRGVGVRVLHPDGSATLTGRPAGPEDATSAPLLPNGVLPEADGTYLVANIGPEGGLWRASRYGLDEVPLDTDVAPLNFVTRDPGGHLWATVSTRCATRSDAYHADLPDGLLLRMQEPPPGQAGAAIRVEVAAEGLHYPNEIGFSADGSIVYVNETTAFRTSAFTVTQQGLSPRRTVAQFAAGDFCDGLTVDRSGQLWVTCIVSNRLYTVSAGTQPDLVLDDGDPEFTAAAVAAYNRADMGRTWFDTAPPGACVPQMSSLSFSPDGHAAVLGCLLGDQLHSLALG